jgi:hypothetical protein
MRPITCAARRTAAGLEVRGATSKLTLSLEITTAEEWSTVASGAFCEGKKIALLEVAPGLQRLASVCRNLQPQSLESLGFLAFLRLLGLLLICGLGVRFPPGSPVVASQQLVEPCGHQSSWLRLSGSPT